MTKLILFLLLFMTNNMAWPDTLIPLFIIDHFAKHGLIEKFNTIAAMAEKHKDMRPTGCVD